MKKINIIRFLLVFSCISLFTTVSIAQKIELCFDTLDIVTIGKIDKKSRQMGTFSRCFVIKDKIYDGNNFHFMSIKAHCQVPPNKTSLYYLDYKPIINDKGIDKLLSVLRKQKYISIDAFASTSLDYLHAGKDRILDLVNCVRSKEAGDFVIAVKKITAAYLLLACEPSKGLDNIVFCPEKVDSSQSVVILNIVKTYQ